MISTSPIWTRPSAADKRRPVVIVSSDAMNRTVDRLGAGAVTVVPATSNVNWIYDFQVLLQAEQMGQIGRAHV